jgi:hypothetical protein
LKQYYSSNPRIKPPATGLISFPNKAEKKVMPNNKDAMQLHDCKCSHIGLPTQLSKIYSSKASMSI